MNVGDHQVGAATGIIAFSHVSEFQSLLCNISFQRRQCWVSECWENAAFMRLEGGRRDTFYCSSIIGQIAFTLNVATMCWQVS